MVELLMRTVRFLILPVVILGCLINNVQAIAPAYIKTSKLTEITFIDNFLRFTFSLIMFILILAAAYYVAKLIAKKGAFKTKTKNMKIVEILPISTDKNIVLIKVGKKYVLIGNVPKNIVCLSSFDEEELGIIDSASDINKFDDNIEAYIDEYKLSVDEDSFNTDNTYLSNMKNNLNRLKSMVRGSKSDE